VGIVGGVLASGALLVVPVGLLQTMRGDIQSLTREVTALRSDVRDLREDRWTRSQQGTWVRDEFAPLEARVRALEVAP